jgi:hypothetical protein
MPQTNDALPLACGLLELASDLNCVGWADISGSSQALSGLDQSRITDQAYTLDGDGAIVTSGKKEPMELVVEIVYTETAGEAFELVRAVWEAPACGGRMCLRWSPGGGDIGDALYTTDRGYLISFTYPPLDATAGGPIMAGFTLKVGEVTRSIVAT